VAVVALVASALVSALHLLGTESSEGVRASFDRILAGDLRSSFLLGGGVCGVVVPLIGLAVLPATSGVVASLLMLIVALCRLYGDFAYRKAIVVAGAYEPVMPGWQMRTFVNPPPTAPVSGAPSH
jgi:formate-dependent nitrite reductase membrane component NrfD